VKKIVFEWRKGYNTQLKTKGSAIMSNIDETTRLLNSAGIYINEFISTKTLIGVSSFSGRAKLRVKPWTVVTPASTRPKKPWKTL